MHPSRMLRSAHHGGPKPSITGFDTHAFIKAASKPRYDPWERAEAWRYKGQFSRWNRLRGSFPGLGVATVAFAAYCAYEHFVLGGGEHGHGEEGHH